jgi:hypothetical protein
VLNETYGDTTAVACDSLVWHGKTYYTSGDYNDTLVNVAGGDSILTLHLTLNQATVASVPESYSGCDVVTVYGKDYLASGTYTDTLVNAVGCDSIVTLNVTVLETTYGDTVAADFAPITWYEHTCSATGDYVHTFYGGNSHGCDSVLTLHFTLLTIPETYGDTIAAECDVFTWYEHTCATTGDYVHTFVGGNAAGGDSIVTLHFTLLEPTYGDTTATGCSAITWYEHTCAATGDYIHTFVGGNSQGCDSVVTLHFTLLEATASEVTVDDACESYEWNGQTYTASGDYTFTTTNAAGCDSVVTLHLTIKRATASEVTVDDACESYEWNGQTYTASGDYTFTTTNAAGCDSVVTLHLTVNHSTSSEETHTECYSYEWNGETYTASGDYTFTTTNAAGCDSVATLHLTINSPYVDTLKVYSYYGDRIIMINLNQINSITGWYLSSVDNGEGYVKWYKMSGSAPAPETDEQVETGYYYTLSTGEPLPAGMYYAVVDIPAVEGAPCGARGITVPYEVAGSAPAPALVPSLARPGENIRVINLDPDQETEIRIYSAEGMLLRKAAVSGEASYTLRAAEETGFYLVEVVSESMKSTLRYIVK